MVENINKIDKIDIIDVFDEANSRKRKFENKDWRWLYYLRRYMRVMSHAKNNC